MKYFLHDSNSFNDEKITELFIRHGYEGLGLFYTVLEKLASQEKPIKTSVLKAQLKVGKKLEKCWSFMEQIGIISSSNGETFNKQLLNYSEKYKIKKEKNAKRISEWRDNQTIEENVTNSENVRNTPKVKESKVKESKEEIYKEEVQENAFELMYGSSSYKPKSEDIHDPPERYIKAVQEYIFRYNNGVLYKPEDVLGLWKAWASVNLIGNKNYENIEGVYSHFVNSHKSFRAQQIKQTNEQQSSTLSPTAQRLLEKRQQSIDIRKDTSTSS